MDNLITGNVWLFGDNISTDNISPARYLTRELPIEELSKHIFEGTIDNFYKKIEKGDIIVAGENFGCGSSREESPIGIKGVGISLIIAESFGRIFFRNSINIGLPLIECKGISKDIKQGDVLKVNIQDGIIERMSDNKKYYSEKKPEFLMDILKAGGLLEYLKKEIM